MATYKISYKMLAKQGDELKAVAKMVDGYAERVNQIRGKLGEDQMLSEVRNNLQKLNTQLGESRTVLNTAGELLSKTVGAYTTTETRQVKKVDNLKAHNRDFYKNPVVVASVGGGAVAGAVASAGTAAPSTTTVNYTETNTVNYTQTTVVAAEPAVSTTAPSTNPIPTVVKTSAPSTASAPAASAVPVSAKASVGGIAGIAAGVGAVGGAIGAGAVIGVKHLMDKDKKDKKAPTTAAVNPIVKNPAAQKTTAAGSGDYDPETELAAALERVRRLEEEE